MPITNEDGYYRSDDLAHVPCLGIESRRLGDCVALVKRERLKGVFGHPRFGFSGSDLDFLVDLPWLEAVWFWDIDLKSVDGLYALSELRHFGIHPKRPSIDFSRFPRLVTAIVEPKAKDRGLGGLSELQRLHIWHYRPKEGTFASFEFPRALIELEINWANATSLDSIPALPHLRHLEIHRCRNLEDLGDLGAKFPGLEHLVVAACGRVLPGEGERVVRALPKLRFAYVRDARLV